MSEYIVNIPGAYSLDQIQLAIQGEEASGAEFLKISLSYYENVITNLATFNDLAPGERPQKDLALITSGTDQPAGTNIVWAGVMLVSSSNMAVTAYR